MELGYKNPVLFERHAIGGEYGAGYKSVGKGSMTTVFSPDDGGPAAIVDYRRLSDSENAVVAYHNPLDNVPDLAHHFFTRCLEAQVPMLPSHHPCALARCRIFGCEQGEHVTWSSTPNPTPTPTPNPYPYPSRPSR